MDAHRTARTAAFTLLEVSLALAIFGAFMVVVLQSMTGVSGYVGQQERLTDLEAASQRLVAELNSEFANAAWYYQADPATLVQTPMYPAVVKGDPATGYGDSIEFLKLRCQSNPLDNDQRTARIDFSASTAEPPVPMSRYYQARSVPSLILNEHYGEAADATTPQSGLINVFNDVFVGPVWETDRAGMTFLDYNDPANLRHYRYRVVVDDSTGQGMLVLEYKNTTDADFQIEHVVAYHVNALTVDTWLSDAGKGLNQNQIRVVVTLEKNGGYGTQTLTGSARAGRVIVATFAMRSITNSATN